jgi:hypothetical protein
MSRRFIRKTIAAPVRRTSGLQTGLRIGLRAVLAGWLAWSLGATAVHGAGPRPRSNIPPSLEIEVLDPAVDPLANPAVRLNRVDENCLEVEIPPTVLVHRYYYSGDRSFQGPLLQGGPCIIVANHPRSGERCYIPVQMPAGAPQVTFTGKTIEYDFGEQNVAVVFGWLGEPTIRYQTGRGITGRVAEAVQLQAWNERLRRVEDRTEQWIRRSGDVTTGAVLKAADASRLVTVPARNVAQSLPFGKVLFSGDVPDRLAERGRAYRDAHARSESSASPSARERR